MLSLCYTPIIGTLLELFVPLSMLWKKKQQQQQQQKKNKKKKTHVKTTTTKTFIEKNTGTYNFTLSCIKHFSFP